MSSPLALAVTTYADEVAAARERRAHRRVDLEAEVTLESDHNFYTGLTADISAGGLFVATHALRPRGASVRVRFSLPGCPEPIEADAEVRWERDGRFSTLPPGVGVRFLALPPAAAAAIARFVEARDTIFYEE